MALFGSSLFGVQAVLQKLRDQGIDPNTGQPLQQPGLAGPPQGAPGVGGVVPPAALPTGAPQQGLTVPGFNPGPFGNATGGAFNKTPQFSQGLQLQQPGIPGAGGAQGIQNIDQNSLMQLLQSDPELMQLILGKLGG